MGYAFISYSTKNKEKAEHVRYLLRNKGIDTWMAPNDIPAGSRYAQVIGQAIKSCDCFVLLLTDESQRSPWVAKEVERAVNYKKKIIPIQFGEIHLNDEFELYLSTDQSVIVENLDESNNKVQQLLSDIYVSVRSESAPKTEKTREKEYQISAGSVIDGRYKILRKVGAGGYSVVYLVTNERTNRTYALKVIQKGTEKYRIFKENLNNEISILNRLKHPGIPSVVDIMEDSKQLLVVMEYVEGTPLSNVLDKNGAQKEDVVQQWAIQLCDALDYLHKQTPPIIHNDIKPANIMLTQKGKLTLIDFGTARRYHSGGLDTVSLGTVGYAAPEVYAAGQIDQRSDIYSLGVTMYHAATGRSPAMPPYGMFPVREIDPLLSRGLEYIILKCTEVNPEKRYQSMEELRYDLQNIPKLNKQLSRPKPLQKLMSFFKMD